MMSGNAEFRVVLKIWASAHTTLTAVIVRIGNESASVKLFQGLEPTWPENARLFVEVERHPYIYVRVCA